MQMSTWEMRPQKIRLRDPFDKSERVTEIPITDTGMTIGQLIEELSKEKEVKDIMFGGIVLSKETKIRDLYITESDRFTICRPQGTPTPGGWFKFDPELNPSSLTQEEVQKIQRQTEAAFEKPDYSSVRFPIGCDDVIKRAFAEAFKGNIEEMNRRLDELGQSV